MWWDLSSLRLPLMAALIFVISALLKGYYPRSTHPVWLLMVVFFGAGLLSNISGCVSDQVVNINYVATIIFVVLITERVLKSTKQVWGLLFVTTASLAYLNASDGISSLLGGHTLYDYPIKRGGFSNSNASAMGGAMIVFLQMFVISMMGSGKTANTPNLLAHYWLRLLVKIFLYLILFGTIVFIIKTESRGANLSLAIGVAVWTLLQPKKLRILAAITTMIWVALLVGIPDSYRDRITSAFADKSELDHSAQSRPHYWAIAKQMANDHTFGVGIGCYKSNYDSYDHTDGYFGRKRSVHSSHYSILAETGYPGYVAWILLHFFAYFTLLNIRRKSRSLRQTDSEHHFYYGLSNAIIASMTIFVIGGSFYEIPYNDFTWLMLAITIALSRLQKQSLANPVAPLESAKN